MNPVVRECVVFACVTLVAAGAIVLLLMLLTGCGLPGPKLPAYCTDDDQFVEEHKQCARKAHSVAESEECGRLLDAACGITHTVSVRK